VILAYPLTITHLMKKGFSMSSLRPLLGTALLAALAVLATTATAPAQQYGTIKGRLVWDGGKVPEPVQIVPNKDTQTCNVKLVDRKLVVDPKTKGIPYGFAYVASPKGKNEQAVKELMKAEPEAVIDQKNCEFLPYSKGVYKEQQLVFKSSDPIGHNAHYTGFTNGSKNVVLAPNQTLKVKLVPERRPLTLACDIHPWMHGNIMVFDHPFFTVTGEDGSFEIKGVPAGKQNLVVWQESVGFVTPNQARGMEVTVKAGETADVGEIKLKPKK
jgi:hypothetical protein